MELSTKIMILKSPQNTKYVMKESRNKNKFSLNNDLKLIKNANSFNGKAKRNEACHYKSKTLDKELNLSNNIKFNKYLNNNKIKYGKIPSKFSIQNKNLPKFPCMNSLKVIPKNKKIIDYKPSLKLSYASMNFSEEKKQQFSNSDIKHQILKLLTKVNYP